MEIIVSKSNATIETTVREDMLALNVGSGSLKVLATPALVALMEKASAELAIQYLEEGNTTVGTLVNLEHISPTPLGAAIKITSDIQMQEGRLFVFSIKAFDDAGQIAMGEHKRVAVLSEKFQNKADNKFN
ncbi:MAG: thioesterase family protein [Bacillota bacterium]|nr:thioesterase family protein [Bacillota bacterium]